MPRQKIDVDIYKVIKPIKINETAICQIGDLLMIDESAYDGASVSNLTQKWGFQCFGDYESVQLITKKTLTWDEYIAIYHGKKELIL